MRRAALALLVLIASALGACSGAATPTGAVVPKQPPTAPASASATEAQVLTPSPSPRPTWTPTPTSTPTPTRSLSPTATPTPALIGAEPLVRGLWEELWPEPPARPFEYSVVRPAEIRRVPNALRQFWVADARTLDRRELTARLRVQTAHGQWWVEEGVWHDIGRLQRASVVFETQIYPRVQAALGTEWTPGVDSDPHIVLLHAAGIGEGVGGYTTSVDEFPRAEEPFSNEAEMIVVSTALDVGSPAYYAVLARQLALLIQWPHDRNESQWVEQGLADLSVRLCGIESDAALTAYLSEPDVALAAGGNATAVAARRGAADLLMTYFHERFRDAGTRALVSERLNGVAGLEAVVSRIEAGLSLEAFLSQWLVATYLDDEPGASSLHGYDRLQLERPAVAAMVESAPASVDGSVYPFGVDYIAFRTDQDLQVSFEGVSSTPLLDLGPRSGERYWWSSGADESRATLTRSYDLSGIDEAALTYWVWYDIEPGYDRALIEVSVDGGVTWRSVSATGTIASRSASGTPEWIYTGSSRPKPEWRLERVDLTPFTGEQSTMVRFVYLTDAAETGLGIALDDIALLELGHRDGAERGEGDWAARGFITTDGFVPQRYLAILLGLGDQITVSPLSVGRDRTASWVFPLGSAGWREAVLVVSGLAPMTSRAAPYSLQLQPVVPAD